MWNSLGLTIVTICVCVHQLSAQQQQKLLAINGHLKNIIANAQMLQAVVQAELGQNIPNPPVNTNAVYSSFLEEVELRLKALEDNTAQLQMRMGSSNPSCPQATPPPPPTNVVVESATMDNVSSIVVRWDPPNPVPDNLQYKVYFSAVDETGYQPQGEVVFRICDSTQTSASITDLAPRSKYQVRIGTVAGIVSESSSAPEFVETPDIIPSAPTIMVIEPKNPNTVYLQWDPPVVAGRITDYVIYYKEDGDATEMMEVVSQQPNMKLSFFVNDLSEGTRYVMQVAARSNNGEGDRSIPREVFTIDFNPPHPLNLNCTSLNKTAVILTWEPPVLLPTDGIIRGYNINYTDSRYREFYLYKSKDATVTQAVIDGLEPATVYYFQASSRTRKTFGGGGAVVMCQTKADVPTAPRSVQLELSRADPPQLTMRWIPPQHTYGPLVNYTLHWGVKNGALRKEKIDPTRLRWISDFLDDDTVHEFKLYAVNNVGFGEPAIQVRKTPKRETIVPPNVTVDRVKGENNTTMLRVKWDPPLQPVKGYDILYRKFEWVYSGRWALKEIGDPTALMTEIIVNKPENSFIVVVQGKPTRRQAPQFQQMNPFGNPMGGNMGQPMNRGGPSGAMMGGQNPFANGNVRMQGNQQPGPAVSMSQPMMPGQQGGFSQNFRP
ncbi:fibronectin type III domain-containing protein 2-like isoform X1 [Saccostrea cucullata]|uniref:fibronectin type III domain-containing protein 2-like isoform X1 n=2 Tax=Saccostrea cuccullata TaxID=36930 RepID=UPI002ED01AB0